MNAPSWVTNLVGDLSPDQHSLEQDLFWDALWAVCALAGDADPQKPELTTITVPGFPEKQIGHIFQTQDSDHLTPRIQLLVQRISDRYSPHSEKRVQHENNEVTGVLRLLAAIYEQREHCTSAVDRARLLGVMGMLCRNHTGKGNAQLAMFWENQGLEYLNRAVLLADQVPGALQRHLHWLIADTLIGSVNHHGLVNGERDEDAIVKHLVKACKGDPLEATTGLYFSCITRVFTLRPQSREAFASELLEDLHRAWCLLSAASIKDDEEYQAGENQAEEPNEDLRRPSELFSSLPIEELKPILPDLLEWHAEDRFAVCTLLSWFERGQQHYHEAKVFGYEAGALRSKLNESRLERPAEPGVTIHHVRQLMHVADKMSSISRPKIRLDESVLHLLPQAAVPLVEAGKVKAAIRAINKRRYQTRYSFERDMCRLWIGQLRGESNDSKREKIDLLSVLKSLNNHDHSPRYAAVLRAETSRLLARHAANRNTPQELDKWLAMNHEAVGEAASPLLACIANNSLFVLRKDSDVWLEERLIQGQLIWLSVLWDTSAWIDGSFQSNVGKYRRFASSDQRRDDDGPRAFAFKARQIHTKKNSAAEILALVEEGCQMDPGELHLPWANGIVILFEKIRLLPNHYNSEKRGGESPKSAAYQMLGSKTDYLSRLIHEELKYSRSTDVREKLAMVLCDYYRHLSERRNRAAEHDKKVGRLLAIASMKNANFLAQGRIAKSASCSRARQNAYRRQLRRLVRSASEARLLPKFKRNLNELVDECKTNDAEVAQLYKPPTLKAKDFEDFASSTLDPVISEVSNRQQKALSKNGNSTKNHRVSSSAARGHKKRGVSKRLSARPTLNFFLPGYSSDQSENPAFAVLRRRASADAPIQDQIFPLPKVHQSLREFIQSLKHTRRVHRKKLGLSADGKMTNIPRLISDLSGILSPHARDPFSGNNGDELNDSIDELQQNLYQLGKALLPQELLSQISGLKELVVVPDGKLFMVPIHAIPYNNSGRSLLDHEISISYRPRSDYGSSWSRQQNREGLYASVNTDDEDFVGDEGVRRLIETLDGENSWDKTESPEDTLEKIAASKLSILMTHGHSVGNYELASRLAMKDGRCLTTLDIAQSHQDFGGSSVFLFACNSTPQRTAIGRDLLGPAGSFLTKGVSNVSASIWKCQISDAASIAQRLCVGRPNLSDAPRIWSDSLRELGSRISCPLDKFVRVGCFMLYSSK